MNTSATPQQSAVIIVTNPEGKFKSLNIPEGSYGKTFSLQVGSGSGKLDKPRRIQMDALPSAAEIELTGRGGWSLKLKTTHQPSSLNNQDVHYFVRTYSARDFIKEGFGMEVVATSGHADPDTLTTVTVKISPQGKPTL